ncbi:MAG: tetratricopeptide repeat protein [Bacteroidaceae bacterium]|nr:tetratricopeptide repeat protein [Bacteroidaceae bacterium]
MKKYYRICILLLLLLSALTAVAAETVEARYEKLQQNYSYEGVLQLLKYFETEGIATRIAEPDRNNREQAMAVVDAAMSDYYFNNDDKKALEYIEKTLSVGRKLGDDRLMEMALCQKGSLFRNMGEYDKSMVALNEALPLAEKLQDLDMQTFCNYILAQIYLFQKRYDAAIVCFEKALKTAQNDYDKANCYGMIGETLCERNNFDEALDNIQKAIVISQKAGDENGVAAHTMQRAAIYKKRAFAYKDKSSDDAETDFMKVIPFYEKIGDTKNLALCYTQLGDIFILKKNYTAAAEFAEKALEKNLMLGDKYQVMLTLRVLSFANREINPKKAWVYYTKYDSIKDLIFNDKQSELLVQYETVEKERTIEKQQTEIKQRQMRMQLGAIGAVVIILAIILFFAVRTARSNRLHAAQLKVERDEATAARDEATVARGEAEKARDEAEKANKLKGVFIENVVHELRTPINAIQGFNQLLTDEDYPPSPEESMEYMGYITDNCNLLITLVQDTLDVSQMESGNYPMNISSFSLKESCQKTLEKFSDKVQPGVQLQLAECGDFSVTSDRVLIERLIANYVSNACKYTYEGSITLAFCKTGEENWEVAVTDTGVGIAAENAEKVFDRYEKLGSYIQGNGIGLAIVRLIAYLLHGKAFMDTAYTAGGCRFVAQFDCKES